MHLKSLEIQGFKSFADKIKLEFGSGITCIVGPNGSGKSNVCDALRWVLGEQSIKSLRGAKLEDIIFNGSEGRKPLGMAAVTLAFDNSSGLLPLDFNEVTVSRRVYRSGESEFFINKVPCRLKDIQELFNDTGLGKEAFAIIGQGQVDAILSSRPEERRALFEEAAGIVRYRNRKMDATRKLESTSTNLDRLRDLLYELEHNLTPLQEEAEKARLYAMKDQELYSLEISLACLDLERLRGEQQKAADSAMELQSRIWEKESRYTKLTARWEETQLVRLQLEEKERVWQQEIYRLQTELNMKVGEKALSEERAAAILEREAALQGERKINQLKLDDLEAKYSQEQKQLEAVLAVYAPQKDEIAAGEKQLELDQKALAACLEKGEQLKADLFDVEQRLASLHNNQLEIQFGQKNLKQQETRLKEESKNCEFRKSELLKAIEVVVEGLTKKKARLELSGQESRRVQEHRHQLKEGLGVLREQREQVQQALNIAKSRIKVLEEMKENLEGYNVGVRNLLQNPVSKGELKILGVVGELLKVASQYEKAIEVALGGAVQYLVTATDQEAQKAIRWLKKEKAGRATFLPLNTLQPRKFAREFQALLGDAGVIGLAAELVQISPGQQIVVDYLLGTVVIVTELEAGLALAKKSRFSVKIVTLGGDVIFPGGSLTGGSQKQGGAGFLGRTREILEQRNLLEGLEAKRQEMEAGLQSNLEKEQGLEEEEQRLKEEMSRLRMEISAEETEREKLAQELSNEQKKMEGSRWEEEQLFLEQRTLEQEFQRLLLEEQELKKKKHNLLKIIEQYRTQEGVLQARLKSLEKSLVEQKIESASQREKQKALENSLSSYREHQREALALKERMEEELSQLAQRKKEREAALTQLDQEVNQLRAAYQQVEEVRKSGETEKLEILPLMHSLETQVTQLAKELKELREQDHQIEMQKARQEVQWENALNRLGEKFNLTWDEAKKHQLSLPSRREAEERVRILRKEIAGLGSVNPNAAQEYQRLEERYQFLTEQQQDLVEAREGLFQIIKEMEKIMGLRFTGTFAAVETAFQEVFSYLFDGGKASLELTGIDNILESGIEIIAQPPGKKKQNLSLLSGGERALTATALLFAFLKVKPSPFCVLDEIEANLDEANVDRFARYLREFAAETQFILVSHRQGTMEAADALYGVAMEESGVSRLVSVKLASIEEVS